MIRSGRLNDDPRENVHVTKLHEDVLNTKDKSFLAKIYGTSISNGPVKHVKSLEILKYWKETATIDAYLLYKKTHNCNQTKITIRRRLHNLQFILYPLNVELFLITIE